MREKFAGACVALAFSSRLDSLVRARSSGVGCVYTYWTRHVVISVVVALRMVAEPCTVGCNDARSRFADERRDGLRTA